jgi:hypothetical protein
VEHRGPPQRRPAALSYRRLCRDRADRYSLGRRRAGAVFVAGRPLTSHEVIVNLIEGTTARTGLTVRAELDTADYPDGIKITNQQLRELETKIHRHEFHGERNYTFHPDDTP